VVDRPKQNERVAVGEAPDDVVVDDVVVVVELDVGGGLILVMVTGSVGPGR
jgi:hypothetical protein